MTIRPVKGVAVEIKGSVDHFHGHIRTQRGQNPSKQQIRIKFRKFRNSKKYYTRVLNYGQIWFS